MVTNNITYTVSTTTVDDLIAGVVAQVIKQLPPSIPVEVDLWSSAEIAAYLKRNKNAVMDRIVCKPGFPKRITIDGGHPRWKASEVIEWAERQRER